MSHAEQLSDKITQDDLTKVETFGRANNTAVLVIFFDDIQGSTALKQQMTATQDEEAFQTLRRGHDALLTGIITRDGAGTVIKSTGDGLLAVFLEPSTAVERAVEIQEALRHHPSLRVRIGMDMGQIRVEAAGGTQRDMFGRHVDWAARAESLADGGHIIVTRSVYIDASGWIDKARVQWKEHGLYRVKEGEDAIEAFEPYNSNITAPMENLRGRLVQNLAMPVPNANLRYMPRVLSRVIGREGDVLALQERLGVVKGPHLPYPVTIIRGWPGVGKTTLATLVANDRDTDAAFPDGILWVSLGQTPDLLTELAKWGGFVGGNVDDMRRAGLQEAVELLAVRFRQKRMLLIVDDVWAAEAAAPFLDIRGAACPLLFTTRVSEVADHIVALFPDADYYLDVLSPKKAMELLGEAVPTVVNQQPEACLQLAESLGYLPLALRVAGRLLHAESSAPWGVTNLLTELQDGASIIKAKAPADLAAYERDMSDIPTVAALLKKSIDVLDYHMQHYFAFLGFYSPKPNTFDLAAMQAIWQVEDAKPIVRVLVNRGLLEPVGDRFQMHALLLSLARSLLED